MGALAYVDDVTLLSPSLSGLQQMLNVCKEYSDDFHMIFNDKKTVCIKFCNDTKECGANVYLGGCKLQWSNKVKHLGNMVNSNLSHKDDILYKKSNFTPL